MRLSETSNGLVRNKQLVLSKQGRTATRTFLLQKTCCSQYCWTSLQSSPLQQLHRSVSKILPEHGEHDCPILLFGILVNWGKKRNISSQNQRQGGVSCCRFHLSESCDGRSQDCFTQWFTSAQPVTKEKLIWLNLNLYDTLTRPFSRNSSAKINQGYVSLLTIQLNLKVMPWMSVVEPVHFPIYGCICARFQDEFCSRMTALSSLDIVALGAARVKNLDG